MMGVCMWLEKDLLATNSIAIKARHKESHWYLLYANLYLVNFWLVEPIITGFLILQAILAANFNNLKV